MRLAAGVRPDELGSYSAPPDPPAAIGGGVPTSKVEGKEGNGRKEKGEGREGEGGKGKGRKEREGREGTGRMTCIPHYFRPCSGGLRPPPPTP